MSTATECNVFHPEAHVGRLILFYVRELRHGIVVCDLVIFNHLDVPRPERNVMIFQSPMIASLKQSVRALPVLGRIKQTHTSAERRTGPPPRPPVYFLGPFNERDAEQATEYLIKAGLDPFEAAEVRLDSPIEEAFWNAHRAHQHDQLDGLVTQHPVLAGRYRLDFALPDQKIGIELDGYAYHSTRKAFTQDRERQRAIEAAGWRIIRFSGAEIHANATACVRQAAELVTAFEHRR